MKKVLVILSLLGSFSTLANAACCDKTGHHCGCVEFQGESLPVCWDDNGAAIACDSPVQSASALTTVQKPSF